MSVTLGTFWKQFIDLAEILLHSLSKKNFEESAGISTINSYFHWS